MPRLTLRADETRRYARELYDESAADGHLVIDRVRLTLPHHLHFARPRTRQSMQRVLVRAEARVAAKLGGRFEAEFWRRMEPARRRARRATR